MEIIRKNFGLKLIALGLAILGWAYFRFAANPVLGVHFDQQMTVPINAINVPVGYIARFSVRDATITIASQRGEPAVQPGEIKAVLDLTGRAAGAYNVPVQAVAPLTAVVQSVSPGSVALTVESIVSKSFPISLHYSNRGSPVVVGGTASTTPAVVVVRGAQSDVAQVASLRLNIPVPSSPEQFDEMIRPVPVDANGTEIAGLQVSPDLVRVQIAFVAGSGGAGGGSH